MDHAVGVRVRQPAGDVDADPERLEQRHRSQLQASGERLAFEQLEDEVWPELAPAHVVEGHDVRVAEPGRRFRLAEQPFPALARSARRAHGLESNRPSKLAVPGLVDDSEAATAELPDELEPADDGAWLERRAPSRAAGPV